MAKTKQFAASQKIAAWFRRKSGNAVVVEEESEESRAAAAAVKRDLVVFFATVLLSGAALALVLVYVAFADLDDAELRKLEVPSNLAAAQSTAAMLTAYVEAHYVRMYIAFGLSFLYVQAFFIPVSSFLNLLAGAWFGLLPGLFICCLCTAAGSTVCYLCSKLLLSRLIQKFAPHRVVQMRRLVSEHAGEDLPLFLTSLFVMPCPHTVIKVVCPHVGVPIGTFFWSCFLGLIPYNVSITFVMRYRTVSHEIIVELWWFLIVESLKAHSPLIHTFSLLFSSRLLSSPSARTHAYRRSSSKLGSSWTSCRGAAIYFHARTQCSSQCSRGCCCYQRCTNI